MFGLTRKTAVDPLKAIEIMGQNYYGLQVWLDNLGFEFLAKYNPRFPKLGPILFSEKTLLACKDSHILFADLGLSIKELRSFLRDFLPPLDKKPRSVFRPEKRVSMNVPWSADDLTDQESYFLKESAPTWRLIPKTQNPRFFGKNFDEQKSLLSSNEEILEVRALICANILHFLQTGKFLFSPREFSRCADPLPLAKHEAAILKKKISRPEENVIVGFFDPRELLILYHWEDDPLDWEPSRNVVAAYLHVLASIDFPRKCKLSLAICRKPDFAQSI